MKEIPSSILTLTAGVLITIISFWVGQHHGLMPEQASEQAPLVDNLFNVMVMIGTALFLVVQGAIIVFMIKYRRRAGDDTDGLHIEGNLPLEAFWTAIPAAIVIFLGIYSVDVFDNMGGLNPGDHGMMSHHHVQSAAVVAQAPSEPAIAADTTTPLIEPQAPYARYGFGANPDQMGKPPALSVNVTGMQYAWLFNYPGGVVTGELHIPAGRDVQLNLSAKDVIHSFWVPQFRLKQDALPGQPTELRFIASKPGTYPVVCAELCGSYHGGMRTQVIVHTQADYDQWWASTQVAQALNQEQAIAVKPSDLSAPEFLAPYADQVGVSSDALAHLKHHHQSGTMISHLPASS
jgi:cytochrome c oxidase subunit II